MTQRYRYVDVSFTFIGKDAEGNISKLALQPEQVIKGNFVDSGKDYGTLVLPDGNVFPNVSRNSFIPEE